jgi:hypothetical protein
MDASSSFSSEKFKKLQQDWLHFVWRWGVGIWFPTFLRELGRETLSRLWQEWCRGDWHIQHQTWRLSWRGWNKLYEVWRELPRLNDVCLDDPLWRTPMLGLGYMNSLNHNVEPPGVVFLPTNWRGAVCCLHPWLLPCGGGGNGKAAFGWSVIEKRLMPRDLMPMLPRAGLIRLPFSFILSRTQMLLHSTSDVKFLVFILHVESLWTTIRDVWRRGHRRGYWRISTDWKLIIARDIRRQPGE